MGDGRADGEPAEAGSASLRSAHRPDAEAFAEYAPVFAGLAVHGLSRALAPAQAALWREVLPRQPEDFGALLQALAASSTFRAAWARRSCCAPLLLPRQACVERAITLADVAAGLAAAADQRESIPVALGILHGPGDKINSELPPVRALADLEEVLNFGTVFVNAASKHWRSLAAMCRTVCSTLGFPANINIYATAPGRSVSTPVHTDHHDVLVLQVQGEKRWRVFPPPPRRPGVAHPCRRGKHEDVIGDEELGEPVLDASLRPGECLFLPAGFAHATSTCSAGTRDDSQAEPSVHLTLGISAADCGLTYGTLCGQVLLELGQPPMVEEDLADETFWELFEPLRLGCLAEHGPEELLERLAADIARLARKVDPALASLDGEGAAELEAAAECVAERWLHIWDDLLEIYHQGYTEVVEAGNSGIVATGLAAGPAASAFHRTQRRSGEGPSDEEAAVRSEVAAVDPLIEAATSSISKYCEFLREHIPETEFEWRKQRGAVGPSQATLPQPLVFEAVD